METTTNTNTVIYVYLCLKASELHEESLLREQQRHFVRTMQLPCLKVQPSYSLPLL